MAVVVSQFPLNVEKVIDGYQAIFRVGPDGRPVSQLLRQYGWIKEGQSACGYESPPPQRPMPLMGDIACPCAGSSVAVVSR